MAIKTGIGIGEAQVYDTSGIVNTYGKLLQKQQQDEAKFQSEIADLISKVDTKGVRDQDKAEIAKMYAATKDLYAQAANTKNFQEKALLKSQIAKAVGDINEYAARSVDFSKKFVDLNNRIAQDYYDYDQKVLDKLREVGSKSLLEMGADAQLNPMNYLKRPDIKSRENVFGSIFKRGENFSQATTKILPNGMKQVVKTIPDSFIITNIQKGIELDPEYRRLAFNNLRDSGVDVKSMTPEEIAKAIVDNEVAQYKASFGNKYVGEPREQSIEKKSDSEKNQNQWEGLNAQAFSKNRDQAIENINRIAGSKATLRKNSNGSISVVYKPIVNALSGAGGFFPMESISPKTVIVNNGAELIAALRDAGVTGAGTSSFMKLGGASPSKPKPTPTPKGESLADQMKKAKGGK